MCKEVDNNSNDDDKVQSDNIISTNAKEMIDMSPALAIEKPQVIWAKGSGKPCKLKPKSKNSAPSEYEKYWDNMTREQKMAMNKSISYEEE